MASFALASVSRADEIKDRMLARKPQLDALKDKGAIGENNEGFLTVLEKAGDAASLVADENKDRVKVYEAIAGKHNGADAKLVGRRRAQQIRDNEPKGHKLQSDKGDWYVKK
jgi:uncharacterized protein YdbL (DUF1318 family)